MTAHASEIEQGLKLLEAQKRAQQTRRDKWKPIKHEWRRVMELVLSEHVGRAQRMYPTHLTRLVAKRIHPELSASHIEGLVASRKQWIKEFYSEYAKKNELLV